LALGTVVGKSSRKHLQMWATQLFNESIKIIPVAKNKELKIFVNGKSVKSGSESEVISLNAGEENIITVSVISQDGRTQKIMLLN